MFSTKDSQRYVPAQRGKDPKFLRLRAPTGEHHIDGVGQPALRPSPPQRDSAATANQLRRAPRAPSESVPFQTCTAVSVPPGAWDEARMALAAGQRAEQKRKNREKKAREDPVGWREHLDKRAEQKRSGIA